MLLETEASIQNNSKYFMFVHNCLVEINFWNVGIRGTPGKFHNFRFFKGN